jgi:hypothetical protein
VSLAAGYATIAFVISGLVWILTGRDPLWWAAMSLLVLRAALIQACASGAVAWAHFKSEFPARLQTQRIEVQP